MKKVAHLSLVVLSLAVVAILASCGGSMTAPPVDQKTGPKTITPSSSLATSSTPLKGVSLSPRSFQATDFNAFLSESKKAGEVLSWAGDWGELKRPGSAPFVVAELSRGSS